MRKTDHTEKKNRKKKVFFYHIFLNIWIYLKNIDVLRKTFCRQEFDSFIYKSFLNWDYSKRKEFAPNGSKFFPLRVAPAVGWELNISTYELFPLKVYAVLELRSVSQYFTQFWVNTDLFSKQPGPNTDAFSRILIKI